MSINSITHLGMVCQLTSQHGWLLICIKKNFHVSPMAHTGEINAAVDYAISGHTVKHQLEVLLTDC
jgi:hypothetical protein